MPELPEVETIARGVDARVRGDEIVQVWFGSHREPFKATPRVQAQGLEGRTIVAAHRTGKHIVVELASGGGGPEAVPDAQWIVHLGMTGRLLVSRPDAPVEAHTHARLTLASGRELRFVDPRRFGRLDFRMLRGKDGFEAAGEEPLTIGAEAFAGLFRGRKLAIKAALLNQTLLTGVGNIYADESLFRAGIRPRRAAGRLTRAELERLRLNLTLLTGVGNIYADESLFRAGIRPRRAAGRLTRAELERLRLSLVEVLRHAIRLGGSSVSDYVDAEGVRGFFQLEHCVYQRTGEPCRRCGTPIRKVTVGGRSTHYCPQCQR